MKIDLSHNLFKPLKKIELSAEEKQLMRGRLLAYSTTHPVAEKAERYFLWGVFSGRHWRFAALFAIIVVIFSGAGVALASERSLPGDVLYPVKLQFTEKLRLFAAITPATKIRVELSHLENRLWEAEELSSEGRFGDDNTGQLKRSLNGLLASLDGRVREFDSQGDLASAISLSSSMGGLLQAHTKVLAGLNDQSSQAEQNGPFLEELKQKASDINQNRQGTESRFTQNYTEGVGQKSESKRRQALENLDAAESLVETSGTVSAELSGRLEDARAIIRQGDDSRDRGDHAQSYLLYQRSVQSAAEIQVLARAGSRFSSKNTSSKQEQSRDENSDDARDNGALIRGQDFSGSATSSNSSESNNSEGSLKNHKDLLDDVPLELQLRFGD